MPPAASAPITVLFDLDGTLIDTIELLLASMRHAFRARGLEPPTDAEWIAGIGTPLARQLRQFVSSDEAARDLAGAYRAFQLEHHDRLTRPYPGVLPVVTALHERGHHMAIVTSKAEAIATRSVAWTGLAPFMRTIVGVESCTHHKPDPEPVLVALARLGAPASRALFVGDSPHDVAAGNAAGVATAAALWGPFGRAALEVERPTHWLQSITELPALVDLVS